MKKKKELPWLLMLSAADYRRKKLDYELMNGLEEYAMDIEQVREALIEWESLSANKENRVIYEARAKELRDLLSNLDGERRLGREEGIKVGREKGREEQNLENARKMFKEGISIELVMKITGLTREELQQLD
ncbi:hypothetical protein [Fredinandcohnia sp. 179-A 10B2 NHS]|uniref:hypothetical protein n=1 Tax=Fredinandcohnia sp. 179-A 10B2 NHS TaxID=3235176 RepID=UPI0039A1B30C